MCPAARTLMQRTRFSSDQQETNCTMTTILEYDAWATGQILEAATTPGSTAWTRDLNGPRTSLRQQLVHLSISS